LHIHEGSGNVYADLGYRDAEEMLVKAKLVRKISEIIRSRGLAQPVGPPQAGRCAALRRAGTAASSIRRGPREYRFRP